MPGGANSRGARRAGQYLESLLSDPDGPYRQRWTGYARRHQDGAINYLAVSGVIADHLQDFPEKDSDRTATAADLMHRVRRALRGDTLTKAMLDVFIAAFEMDEHALVLSETWSNRGRDRIVIGTLGNSPPVALMRAPRHKTKRLYELHEIGRDGIPSRHQTIQTIEALEDGVSSHRYAFDTNEVSVRRIHGGTPGAPYHVTGSIWAVDIELPRTLGRGEEASLQYETDFCYSAQPEPIFRRIVHGKARDVVLRVAFHPQHLPRTVWWTEWEDYRGRDDRIVWEEIAPLDGEHSSERHLIWFERAVAGSDGNSELHAPEPLHGHPWRFEERLRGANHAGLTRHLVLHGPAERPEQGVAGAVRDQPLRPRLSNATTLSTRSPGLGDYWTTTPLRDVPLLRAVNLDGDQRVPPQPARAERRRAGQGRRATGRSPARGP